MTDKDQKLKSKFKIRFSKTRNFRAPETQLPQLFTFIKELIVLRLDSKR